MAHEIVITGPDADHNFGWLLKQMEEAGTLFKEEYWTIIVNGVPWLITVDQENRTYTVSEQPVNTIQLPGIKVIIQDAGVLMPKISANGTAVSFQLGGVFASFNGNVPR